MSLTAGTNIDDSGQIGAALLTGSAGGHALLPGGGAPTANRIGVLESFASQTGFLLRDGLALTIAGPVSDPGSVSVAVAPPGAGPAGYGIGDLTLAGPVSSPGLVALQATGNVVEQAGGAVIAGTLIAQAGVIPGTEPGGNVAGTIPGAPVALASIWLGNANQVGTLADATATQEFLLTSGPNLLVPAGGTVLAGAAPGTIPAASTAGTPIVPNANPTVAITITAGDLTVNGAVHAGLDGARTGDVALSANDAFIDGGVFAANAGAATVSAAGSIEIPGIIWGDAGAPGSLAGFASLTAGTSIDEPGQIGTNLLTGRSGSHASLTGTNPYTGNRIVSLGAFNSDTTTDDPAGFVLHDGFVPALTVTGPVTDHGTLQSQGVVIALAPAGTLSAGYGLADLVIANTVSSGTTVDLQATGNVYETAGAIIGPHLRVQAGSIPGTEAVAQANQPGTAPATPLGLASVWLGNVNQVGTLDAATATAGIPADKRAASGHSGR